MTPERLVTMANDIGSFFAGEAGEGAAVGVAEHLRKFWDPRMRAGIVAHYRAGGGGLDEPARSAVALLAAETNAA